MSRIQPVVSIRSSAAGFTYPYDGPTPMVGEATDWVTLP